MTICKLAHVKVASYTELDADMALERETDVDEIFGYLRRGTGCILPETL